MVVGIGCPIPPRAAEKTLRSTLRGHYSCPTALQGQVRGQKDAQVLVQLEEHQQDAPRI